jgi:hypothetical protein
VAVFLDKIEMLMEPNPNNPPAGANPDSGSAPPIIAVPLPLTPSPDQNRKPSGGMTAMLLSLFLTMFLADAMVSVADDSLNLFFNLHVLAAIRGMSGLLAMLMVLVIYVLMALTPMIPKRLFLPAALFPFAGQLMILPFFIYCRHRVPLAMWGLSFCQLMFGLFILYRMQGGIKFRWPLVAANRLGTQRFGWRNLFLFILGNIFVLLPLVAGYLIFCSTLAVDHFTDGFMSLRRQGLTMQVRKYVRADGKTIELFPMSHVGDAAFYSSLMTSFPTNAVILMEGVSDNQNLLTNKINYQRMAKSLGVAEQQKEFQPRGEMVRADVDVEVFSTNTIALLNLVMRFHSKGLDPQTIVQLMQYGQPAGLEEFLVGDLLRKRNRHLLEVINARLPSSEYIIVPWGGAHMPEIAAEIQKAGFRLSESREYVAIRFGSAKNKATPPP